MAKSQKNQTFVLKLNTGYLSKHNWDLTLKLSEVRKQSQLVVSLGSSQVLRWMPELTGREDADIKASIVKQRIKDLKKNGNSKENKQQISKMYDELYELQFQPHYMMLVMDSPQDYRYACEHGFKITIVYGDNRAETIKYKRFLGTAGSIKKSTIMFVDEKIHSGLIKKINNGRYEGPKDNEEVETYNGRELNYKFIPAKLNAYFALACSASIQVPWPRIIVVDDVETSFEAVVREVKDTGHDENPDWPSVTDDIKKTITINTCDGMGFITPEMSAKWAKFLNEGDEPLSGYNVRCAFLKGMVFTIDFKQFAEEIVGSYVIKDAWGDERDVRDADVILTVSMLKLWSSYAGCDDYLAKCKENGYEFCIAKSAPHELRNVHTTNYQYLQDFKFTDEQIDALIDPTVSRIKECLGFDWKKLIIYMCGVGLDEKSVVHMEPMCKAIMANPELIKDPYVRSKVSRMIQKRINSAKIGVLDVEGDYAIIGCDPYALLQNMFGMEVTGLLKAGECYHKFWADKGVEEVIAFRAPMTSHENVCKLKIANNEELQKWFKYITTCCMLNGWDTTAIRCNGADYDADTFFTTNNKVLIDSFEYKTTLMCLQDSVAKKCPTEEDYIKSDINGFGDSIGSVTNKATNMISLREKFDPDSEEYKRLTYRISTMMNYQQNAIDRIKGVVARPVPKEWLNPRIFKVDDGDDKAAICDKQINANIAAEIKPWFFIYRYSQLKSELDKYLKAVKSNCKIRFGKNLDALYDTEHKSEEEELFIYNYEKYMPVSRAPGTMNRICWRIEEEFVSTNVLPNVEFDHSILKSDATYTQEEYDSINRLYDEYNKNMQLFLKGIKKNDSSKEDRDAFVAQFTEEFANSCSAVCPSDEILANILIDVCYTSNKNKSFAWDIAGEQIFKNVLKNNNYLISYPIKDDDGDIEFGGNMFSLHTQQIGGDLNVDSE